MALYSIACIYGHVYSILTLHGSSRKAKRCHLKPGCNEFVLDNHFTIRNHHGTDTKKRLKASKIGQMGGWIDGWIDGWMDGWMDGWIGG